MSTNWLRLAVTLSAVASVIFLSLSVFVAKSYKEGEWFPDEFDSALASIIDCTSKENATTCSRPAVKKLLDLKSGADVMDNLSSRINSQQCHHVGHVVGQQSFNKYQDVEGAISQCNRACDSACVHGIIGQAFAAELGLDADNDQGFDLQHLSQDDIRNIGRRLCQSPEACHGVGHTLFQIYAKFESGLNVCRELATGTNRNYCYHGVFMEYADILSSREIRPTPAIEYPSLETLDSICNWPTYEERISCFPYLTRMVVPTLQKNGFSNIEANNRLREICTSYSRKDYRAACIFGIGVASSYPLVKNPMAAVQICQEFPDILDQAACNVGQVSSSAPDRKLQIVEYCSALPDKSLKASCYQAVFYYLNRSQVPIQEIMRLCKDDTLCVQESNNYELIPLEQVLKIFGS